MGKIIKIPAGYGYVHTLEHIDGNLWQFKPDPKSGGGYRLIGFEGEHSVNHNVYALDPSGGPFMSIGCKIEGRTIKSIQSNGVFELIKEKEDENS